MLAKYLTKQRKILLEYLSEHSDEQYTAAQIATALGKDKISISAVYRNLSELEEEDRVKRYVQGSSHEAFYQYMAAEKCCNKIHLSCCNCGKSIHMDEREAEHLLINVFKSTGYRINKTDSVLYGICEACNK